MRLLSIFFFFTGMSLHCVTAGAQWVVTDPGNTAQGIINAAKNIVHTSSTATNMANSFQETVKIYRQGKEYYDGLRKVKNLVRDARRMTWPPRPPSPPSGPPLGMYFSRRICVEPRPPFPERQYIFT